MYLVLDMVTELIGVNNSISASINELDELVVVFKNRTDTIASNAGSWLDDAYHFAGEGIKQRTFADIRTTNNCDCGQCHKKILNPDKPEKPKP